MSKDEKCTCEACKNTVFHCQICKFVTFLLLSSSKLLKLPNVVYGNPNMASLANFNLNHFNWLTIIITVESQSMKALGWL